LNVDLAKAQKDVADAIGTLFTLIGEQKSTNAFGRGRAYPFGADNAGAEQEVRRGVGSTAEHAT
jgi:hypothetical protein